MAFIGFFSHKSEKARKNPGLFIPFVTQNYHLRNQILVKIHPPFPPMCDVNRTVANRARRPNENGKDDLFEPYLPRFDYSVPFVRSYLSI